MKLNQPCHCGRPSVLQTTDVDVGPAVSAHFCEQHASDEELRRAIRQTVRGLVRTAESRARSVSIFAAELGVSRSSAEAQFDECVREIGL